MILFFCDKTSKMINLIHFQQEITSQSDSNYDSFWPIFLIVAVLVFRLAQLPMNLSRLDMTNNDLLLSQIWDKTLSFAIKGAMFK